jgi:hypothetical protein
MAWAAVYYIGVVAFGRRQVAAQARTALIWFAFLVSLEAIVQAFVTPGIVYGLFPSGYREFVMGPIVYHTHFAVFIEAIFPLALFEALGRSKESYLVLCISAVLLTAVVVSASRGGIVLVFAEVVAVLILTRVQARRERTKNSNVAIALTVITAILLVIVGFERASARFSSEALAAGRIQFALSSLHMIAARPFMGWGLGCWPAVYPAFASFDPGVFVNQAHSDWLQWTAEGGVPVGIAMLLLAIWSIKPAIRSIWGIGVLAVLIHAAFDYPFSRPAVGAWPILMLAMVASRTKSSGQAVEPHAEYSGEPIQG